MDYKRCAWRNVGAKTPLVAIPQLICRKNRRDFIYRKQNFCKINRHGHGSERDFSQNGIGWACGAIPQGH